MSSRDSVWVLVIGWLRCASARLSPRARAIVLAGLLLAGAILAVASTNKAGHRAQRPSTRPTTDGTAPSARQYVSPVPAQLARARWVARTFLVGYVPLAYGRVSAASVRAVSHALRWQLRHDRTLITPVERRRRPRVITLTALGQASGAVVVTALIDDGGIADCAVRLTLRQQRAGWRVSRVDGG